MGPLPYIKFCKAIALQESMALRGYAKARITPPTCPPIDYFHLFTRQKGRP